MTNKLLASAQVDAGAVTNRTLFESPFFAALLTVKEAAVRACLHLGLADAVACEQALAAVQILRESGRTLNRCSILFTNRALNAAVDTAIVSAAGVSDDQGRRILAVLQTLQSADDVIATARNLLASQSLQEVLTAVERIKVSLRAKACQFAAVPTVARRRLRDDALTTLGAVFESYAVMFMAVQRAVEHAAQTEVLSLMGTDIGLTVPVGARQAFAGQVCCELKKLTGVTVRLPSDALAEQGTQSSLIVRHGAVQSCAAVFWKLARDIRLLCSGPRCGFTQVSLPALAPGSSIMPGKVNPVILEMAMSSSDQVSANHSGLVMGTLTGWLEFGSESIVPIRAFTISCRVLSQTMINVVEKCIDGMTADEERCRALAVAAAG